MGYLNQEGYWVDFRSDAEKAEAARLDREIDEQLEADEIAFEARYAAEHPDDDYLGRPA